MVPTKPAQQTSFLEPLLPSNTPTRRLLPRMVSITPAPLAPSPLMALIKPVRRVPSVNILRRLNSPASAGLSHSWARKNFPSALVGARLAPDGGDLSPHD